MAIFFQNAVCAPGIDSIKTSILMGKLKQLIPHRVSPDNGIIISMFLIRLLPSMREVIGAGNHNIVTAMVKAVDALWDACGSNDPTATDDTTWHSRIPNPAKGKKGGTQL